MWPGDDDPRSGHYVVRRGGRVLGIGSVVPEAPGWRVRGMATAPAARGRGVGAAILRALLDHAREHGSDEPWGGPPHTTRIGHGGSRHHRLFVYRSPGVLRGYSETLIERSSAVRMMRLCSATWAAG